MNKEINFLKIINGVIPDNSLIGDDCAYLEDLNLLISQDTLIEDVHFKISYFTPFEIGKKAVLVNVSDILSSGGVPKYISVSLSGKLTEDFVQNFYSGVVSACKPYNIKITGGDLTGGDKITVSICILGAAPKNIPSRKNAKEGYGVYLKGYHGSSALGLKMLLSGNFDKTNEFVKAHIEPVLYPEISSCIAQNAKQKYVMMDTSDGLFDALNKVSAQSSVGFNIEFDKIPKKTNDKNLVLFGGEDFGLFICLHADDFKIAEHLKLSRIGTVTNTGKIVVDGEVITEDNSFHHF